MSFRFTKMHALGNNYIYVNQFEESLPEDALADIAIKVASVQTGIGSDGMILICPSNVGAVKMRVFNSDGSEAKNCGNGLRCVAKYSYEKGLVTEPKFKIETLGGIVEAEVRLVQGKVVEVTIDMGKPGLTKGSLPMLGEKEESTVDAQMTVDGEELSFVGVSMGNPHAIFFVEDVEKAPVTTLGPKIEKHELFPEWTNVEFIHVRNPREIDFRVWERGSGVTYACGTGACAAAVAAIVKEKAQKGEAITVHLLGGDLQITWKEDDHIWMTGPAEYICEGIFFL
ncbi:diaminopimelate epimerase [Caldalkalibacillus mannanilyticus]|uniref:diaminopimelate epimerase n=1 Tax=Caldalkalibacillus mannanilyticus TaxID=1418 RepID=UPI000469DBD1|nr:diaminopimelate epimerase [Caldalkalibacillus mannanilyticus]